MEARLLFVHALSPLHPGVGQGAGAIDLPVAREKATGLPYLPGSSLKGVLRSECADVNTRKKVFGPDTTEAHEHAGAVQITDQRLLLFPVRSLKGTFAWVTSPFVLRRFLRDAGVVKGLEGIPDRVPEPPCPGSCRVSGDKSSLVLNGKVILEDLDLTAEQDDDACRWAVWLGRQLFPDDSTWQSILAARFCVVHDEVLGFLLETATEVFTRVRLKEEEKTVERGGLWYEEALPVETVLAGLVVATPVVAGSLGKVEPSEVFETVDELIKKPLQLGGKATVGRGLCRLCLVGGEQSRENA
ncbi:type III-B CRISPR module RAMP protein Cmr4 [Desulfothermobacter acidiphilus]|uniref:type III-B CRISPR module RAMP protein Cmr4 n=1 Tax=Desulfothermobacter acidiphilus TaxID=1938353 RepID=UPI003F8C9800